MSSSRTPSPTQISAQERAQGSDSARAPPNEAARGQQTSQSQYSQTTFNVTLKSSSTLASTILPASADVATTQPWVATPVSMSSTASSSKSPASSTRGGSSVDTGRRGDSGEHRRSSIGRAMDKAKSKLGRRPSGSETLPDDEQDFERQKAKELEKQRRKAEYERLGLGDRTKFGTPGAGGWKAG